MDRRREAPDPDVMTTTHVEAPPAGAVRYLSAVTGSALAFGVVLVVLPGPTEALFGRLIHGAGGFPASFAPEARDYLRLAHAVIGASMAGWFALALWLVRTQVAHGVPGAWRALAGSIALWFVLDTSYSLLSGFWPNAVLNAGFLLAFLPGLLATRPR